MTTKTTTEVCATWWADGPCSAVRRAYETASECERRGAREGDCDAVGIDADADTDAASAAMRAAGWRLCFAGGPRETEEWPEAGAPCEWVRVRTAGGAA